MTGRPRADTRQQSSRRPRAEATAARAFATADVARILGLAPGRVRSIVRAAGCEPQRQGGRRRFAFQDLVLIRAAHELLRAKVPPRRVRLALAELARQLPAERPLSGVRICADGHHVVARDGKAAWRPDSGQIVFSFAVDELARQAGTVVPAHHPSSRRRAQPADLLRDAESWFERALAHEEAHDGPAARAAYRRAIELDPALSDAYINLGRLVHEGGDAAEAARLYRLAIDHAPHDPIAHYDLALAYEDQGQPDAARTAYLRALDLDPEFADAHFNLSRLLQQLGEHAAALEHLRAYKQLTRG